MPNFLTVEVVDMAGAINKVGGVEARVRRAAEVATKAEATRELRLTWHRVPWRTGQLKKSGRVEEVETTPGMITASIAYGGPAGAGENTVDVDYAVIVHEDLEALHMFGRSAKFVESVVREEMESGRAAAYMGSILLREMGLVGTSTIASPSDAIQSADPPSMAKKAVGGLRPHGGVPSWGTIGKKGQIRNQFKPAKNVALEGTNASRRAARAQEDWNILHQGKKKSK